MLEKLLAEIRSGGSFETGRLAARLGTTPEMVSAMLEHLQRSGYIRPYETCGEGCGGCSLRAGCNTQQGDKTERNGVQLFVLNDPK
jgi:hypothetical protein